MCGFDYSSCGAYFVTICAHERKNIFGEIVDGKMVLNNLGVVVEEHWMMTPEHFPFVELDEHVVMPNHFHGVMFLDVDGKGKACLAPTSGRPPARSLSSVIGAFKSSVSKRINELRGTPGASVWQRNFYEHIVRNDEEMYEIQEYIINNPMKWDLDTENLSRAGNKASSSA